MSALVLASCQPLPPSHLGVERTLELSPGEAVHLALVVNAAALAQADDGVYFTASATALGDARLEVVPDDPSLEELVSDSAQPQSTGETILASSFYGGDLRELCPAPTSEARCEVGVTLALVSLEPGEALAPTSVSIRFGVAREPERGWFGDSPTFDDQAAVTLRVE